MHSRLVLSKCEDALRGECSRLPLRHSNSHLLCCSSTQCTASGRHFQPARACRCEPATDSISTVSHRCCLRLGGAYRTRDFECPWCNADAPGLYREGHCQRNLGATRLAAEGDCRRVLPRLQTGRERTHCHLSLTRGIYLPRGMIELKPRGRVVVPTGHPIDRP